jgi:ribosomal protein S18 acetylase RimI-like enzyme
MEVRPLSVADAPGVAAVFQRSRMASMPWLPVLHSDEEDRAFFAGEIDGGHAWGAFEGDRLTGFVIGGDGWIRHLYVAPEHQCHGVGSALLDRALGDEPSPVHLWVFEANTRAIDFYRRRGFEAVERTEGKGNEEGLPDVRMRHPGPDSAPA